MNVKWLKIDQNIFRNETNNIMRAWPKKFKLDQVEL